MPPYNFNQFSNPNVLSASGISGPTQMPSMPTNTGAGMPGFYNPGNPLYQYHDPGTSTNDLFQRGINAAQPSTGVSPQYQSILDTIRNQQDYATNTGSANAISLAARRGLTGSSIEQFGVNQAGEAASRAAQDASSNVLLQNQQQQNALQQLQAQLYGNRAQSLSSLNSDELNSLRNADYSNNYLNLQQSLGQQGLDVARANIGANQDIAQQQARNNLFTSGASILAPYLFGGGGGGMFGGGGGAGTGTPGFFGMSGLTSLGSNIGTSGAGAGGVPLTSAGTGAGFGAGAIPLAGYGAMQLANYGQRVGGTAGAFLANPIGAQLNIAKKALSSGGNAISNAASGVSKAVTSVFPF